MSSRRRATGRKKRNPRRARGSIAAARAPLSPPASTDFRGTKRTSQAVLLRVDVDAELVLRVCQRLDPVDAHVRLAGSAAVLEHLTQLFLLAFRGGQRARQVAVLVRLGALRHLRAHFLFNRRGVRRRGVRQHAHQVGDLHLGLRRFHQPLADHLLFLLLARHATSRAQLFLLRLRQLQRLGRRRGRLRPRRRRQGHGVLHVQRDLLAEHARAVGRAVREQGSVPPLRRARFRERRQKARAGGSRAARRGASGAPRALAQRDRVGVPRRRLGRLAAEDRARLGDAVLRAQAGHVGLLLERALLDELAAAGGDEGFAGFASDSDASVDRARR